MEAEQILSHVDHTALAATTTWEEIEKLCEESLKHKTASICIPPSYVDRVHKKFGDSVNICTVIGFPLGYSTAACKVFETEQAIMEGASEIDMVVNLGDVKNGDFEKITTEIKAIKKAAGLGILKVIVETCYLTEAEKILLCGCVTEAGADYIKTSTGFGTAGAALDDIALFRNYIGANVKIKAAGGIRTLEDLKKFIQAGCERIGSSSAIGLVTKK